LADKLRAEEEAKEKKKSDDLKAAKLKAANDEKRIKAE